jgi:hypothetical protein
MAATENMTVEVRTAFMWLGGSTTLVATAGFQTPGLAYFAGFGIGRDEPFWGGFKPDSSA